MGWNIWENTPPVLCQAVILDWPTWYLVRWQRPRGAKGGHSSWPVSCQQKVNVSLRILDLALQQLKVSLQGYTELISIEMLNSYKVSLGN